MLKLAYSYHGGVVAQMRYKNKGFTLVELLSVIVILAIIALIATPLTINVINSTREKSFINSVYGLIDGVRLLSAERLFIDGSSEVVVNFTNGIADNPNFKVSGDMPDSGTVRINLKGKVELKVWSEELGKCAEKAVNEAEVKITNTVKELCVIDDVALPIIILNGDATVTTWQGTDYADLGANATYLGVDISSDIKVTGEVNTSVVGTYQLKYNVSYDGKKAEEVIRTVIVKPECDTMILGKNITTGEVVCKDLDHNARYVGANPNNYVLFNDKLWRIIGNFDGYTKIIAISKSFSGQYDYEGSNAINDWSIAPLQEKMNVDYLTSIQRGDPTSYSYIDLEHVWNVGGVSTSTLTREEFYVAERGKDVYEGRPTIWQGAIGVAYPSDFGYASELDVNYFQRENSWLGGIIGNNCYGLTMTPSNVDTYEAVYSYIFYEGLSFWGVSHVSECGTISHPVLYLKPNVEIFSGTGTSSDPYILNEKGSKSPVISLDPNQTTKYQKSVTINVRRVIPYLDNTISSLTYRIDGGSEQVVTNNQIVIDTEGEHTLEVIATDNEGNVGKRIGGLYKIDLTPPTITFDEGDSEGIILDGTLVGGNDITMGVTVTDASSSSVTVSGDLASIPGDYELTYTARDEAGNVSTKTRKVTVYCPNVTVMGKSMELCGTLNNDPDQNLRFVGTNPNNYVQFNNELWRIIGAFDGQAKIIRNEYYNEKIKWDDNKDGSYLNDWSSSSLQKVLNETYLKSIQSNDSTSYSYIDTDYQWNIGGSSSSRITRSEFYVAERSETISSVMTSHLWTGAIGLIYPSDYGYSTSVVGDECDSKVMISWRGYNGEKCGTNSWLYDEDVEQWTLTSYSDDIDDVFIVNTSGYVYNYNYVSNSYGVRPVLFLNENVKIVGGKGTEDEPYQLGV